jgi:hypothetical protein
MKSFRSKATTHHSRNDSGTASTAQQKRAKAEAAKAKIAFAEQQTLIKKQQASMQAEQVQMEAKLHAEQAQMESKIKTEKARVYFFESFYITYAVLCPAGSQKLHLDIGLSTVPFVRHIYSLLERHRRVNVHRSLTNVLNKGFTFNPE